MSDYQQPPPNNPYDAPESTPGGAPQPSMSSGAKVLMGLGIGCGVLLLVCCGVGGVVIYLFGQGFNTSDDPATVRRVAATIVKIDVPERLAPEGSAVYTMPFVDRKLFSLAFFAEEDRHSGLGLFQIDADFGDAASIRQQFEESMRESGRSKWRELELEDAETYKAEINGAEAEFRFGKGKDEESDHEVWQAIGTFEGNEGSALLFMQLNAEDFEKEQVVDILKSME